MPQLQKVVLKDRQSTPVEHTFTPRNIVAGVGELVETQGVPVGENRLTVSLRKTGSGRYKGVVKLTVPTVVTEMINGIETPKIVRSAFGELHVDFASTSSTAERNDLLGLLQSALDSKTAVINDALVNLEGIY